MNVGKKLYDAGGYNSLLYSTLFAGKSSRDALEQIKLSMTHLKTIQINV